MQSGTFSDKAKEYHMNQIRRQKRIVFGERPSQISAQTLRSAARFSEMENKGLSMNTSSINQSQVGNVNSGSTSVIAQTQQDLGGLAKNQAKHKKAYILDANSPIVTMFHFIISIIVVPNVLFNLYIMAFGESGNKNMNKCLQYSEILFSIEIIQNFFTSYSDPEHYDTIDSLKLIASRYILNGSFIFHALANIPWFLILPNETDAEQQVLRDLLLFKMLRISRLGTSNFIPEEQVLDFFQKWCYRNKHRDDKIANDRKIGTVMKIFKMTLLTIIITYILGLFWYRFSARWQTYIIDDDELDHWVIVTGLERPSYEKHLGDPSTPTFRLVLCMYYSLTTLSTVGYGDWSPTSIMEKIFGSIIQIFGVTFFSILMNKFQDIVVQLKGQSEGYNEQKLQQWFYLIRRIKNQPNGSGADIDQKLKKEIENHFRYYWDQDRREVLLEKKEYFDAIPHQIQEFIMTHFLFEDIITKPAFLNFFRIGREFDSNFVYQVAFGFMPRRFEANSDDRFILNEEGDVTEIYFIIDGEWAIGYNSHENNVKSFHLEDDEADYLHSPGDIRDKKIMIAKNYKGFGYIGDYYVFASKRSEFEYMAITAVESYAIPKQFMFRNIFSKFPGLHSEMLAESFSRYIKEFRRPVEIKRQETIQKYNKKHQYSNLNPSKATSNKKEIMERVQQKVSKNNSRQKMYSRQQELKSYKTQLDLLNDKANEMFDHMKDINKIVNQKIHEIETVVTKAESLFVEEIHKLIKAKDDLQKLQIQKSSNRKQD